jgi:hypothetical protein
LWDRRKILIERLRRLALCCIEQELSVSQPQPSSSSTSPKSFVKSLALATATVALSTWALGSLWAHSTADDGASRTDVTDIAAVATR